MKRNITRDDFLENQVLSNLKMHEKRNMAAFIINKANLKSNDYNDSLWLIYLDSNQLRKLGTEGSVKNYIWKDAFIIYFIIEEDSSIFYKHNIDTNYSEKMFSIPMNVAEFVFSGNKVIFSSRNSIIKRTKNVQEGTELPFYAEGIGVSANYRNSLFSYGISDEKIVKISGDDIHIVSMGADESGNRIAFISSIMDKNIKSESNNIYFIDTKSEKIEIISAENSLSISNIAFIDKETVIFTGSNLKTYGRNENHEFYTIDLNTKKQSKITEGFDKSPSGKSIITDARFGQSSDFHVYDNHLYFLTLEENGAYLNKINKTGKHEKLSFKPGTIDSFAVLKESILFIGLRSQSLHEIYSLRDGKEYKLTNLNDWLIDNRIVMRPEPLSCINIDGTRIDGWVVKPVDFNESKKYPGILCIHGGPRMIYTGAYSHLMQLLASNGYFVFFCNPRGSDGKGNNFSDIRGNFGSYAFYDLMGFTDEVLKKYTNIDANRLGVTGGSYGGYMTNYIISHTTRFSAAVSERGISNAVSMFNTSDIGYAYMSDYIGGIDLWNNMEAYINDSPLTFANRVKTPTLFVHGKNDTRCNYTESLQMFSAIKYFGIESKFCLFEDENHFYETKGKPLNKAKRFDELLKWFDMHLSKGE